MSESRPPRPAGERSPSLLLDRRQLLKGAAAAGLAAALGGCAGGRGDRTGAVRPRDLIRAENARPGTTDWLLANPRVDAGTRYRCPWIEGYCSKTSVRAGETLAILVSTNPPSPFVLDLYRMGYYGGAGGRHLLRLGPFRGRVQPDPEIGPERLRDCRWEPATHLTIPADWPSGVYLGKLTAEAGGVQSYVVFIVRDDRPCDVLFQSSDTTWAAYNRWPSQWSLYDDGKKVWYWGPGVRVSWNRPYGRYCQIVRAPLSQGSGEFLLWEFPLAFWLEREGYDVSYTSGVDTHADPAGLRRARIWLSVGHDEYWTREMHDNVRAARDAGVSLAFFSANTCYGMIDLGPDTAGVADRAFSRIGQYGPIEPGVAGGQFPEVERFKVHGPDESLLVGARTNYPLTGSAHWTCVKPDHWVFAGTGMKHGDFVPGLVGWEWHGHPAPIRGLEVIAAGDLEVDGVPGRYTATVYPGPRGNFVFNGATIWWPIGLASPPGFRNPRYRRLQPHGPDPRIQRITANVLARAGAHPAP
jgi:hypothetical protein